MDERHVALRRLGARTRALVLHSWQEQEAPVRASTVSLAVPLLPSRAAALAVGVLVAAQWLYALELMLLRDAAPAGAATFAAALSTAWALRARAARRPCAAARRLLLTGMGRLYVEWVGGRVEACTLCRQSLRLGRWLLIDLRLPASRRLRLVLGPDNVPPVLLAALHRRLAGGRPSASLPPDLQR